MNDKETVETSRDTKELFKIAAALESIAAFFWLIFWIATAAIFIYLANKPSVTP